MAQPYVGLKVIGKLARGAESGFCRAAEGATEDETVVIVAAPAAIGTRQLCDKNPRIVQKSVG